MGQLCHLASLPAGSFCSQRRRRSRNTWLLATCTRSSRSQTPARARAAAREARGCRAPGQERGTAVAEAAGEGVPWGVWGGGSWHPRVSLESCGSGRWLGRRRGEALSEGQLWLVVSRTRHEKGMVTASAGAEC